ncbi:hypothetical protein ACFFRR_006475 [Megaselia abdita]
MVPPRENNERLILIVGVICSLWLLDKYFSYIPSPKIVNEEPKLPLTLILKDTDNDTISIINLRSVTAELPLKLRTTETTTKRPETTKKLRKVDPSIASNELYQCYSKTEFNVTDASKIPDLLGSERQPTPDKTIFFLVTNCLHDGMVKITARQACAIESAAVTNPDFDIFVVFSSPSYLQDELPYGVLQSILRYKNVFLRYSNPWRFTKGTPAEQFFKKGEIFKSKYFAAHMSDLLRIITLWRWGGTYMDLDIVMKKNIANLTQNFAGAESDSIIANGVMNYESKGFGHYIADSIFKDLVANYKGDVWAHNGPLCVTRILANKICKTWSTSKMTADNCHGFRAMPRNAFYAIYYPQHHYFFEEPYLKEGLALTKDSILIHVWNKLSSQRRVKVGSKTLYGVHAEQYCPRVYGSCGDYF